MSVAQHETVGWFGLRLVIGGRGAAPAREVVGLVPTAMRAQESPLAISLRHRSQSLSGTLSSVPMPKAMKRAMNNAPGIRATSQKASQPGIQAACWGVRSRQKSFAVTLPRVADVMAASVSNEGRWLSLRNRLTVERLTPMSTAKSASVMPFAVM